MDQALSAVIEMNEVVWSRLKEDLKDLSADEANWRPLPQANNINLIVRHLRIEAQWKLASLERGDAEPFEATESLQRFIDSVGFDFEQNLKVMDELCTRFVAVLREMDEATLLKRSHLVYDDLAAKLQRPPLPPHFLSFHHPMHLAGHLGQIRTIRTLYKKTRGEPVPAEFYPDNPTFPGTDAR